MKTIKNLYKLSLIAVLLVSFAACSSVSNEIESLSDEDIAMAAQVVSESMSSENSGVMSSVYDAVSNVDESGIEYGDKAKAANDPTDRGHESSYSYTYDEATGMHTISYNRSAQRGEFSKSVSLVNTYIFKTPEGNFIARPRADRDSIESIDFTGNKSGSHTRPHRSSEFARADTFAVSGLHSTSSIVTIDGIHYGEGSASGTLEDGTQVSRSFAVNIELDNVTIDKDSVATYSNLEQGVNGTLNYSVALNKVNGDRSEEKVVEGTIEFVGDGTALLRFKKIPKIIRFSLKDGSTDEE